MKTTALSNKIEALFQLVYMNIEGTMKTLVVKYPFKLNKNMLQKAILQVTYSQLEIYKGERNNRGTYLELSLTKVLSGEGTLAPDT